jgi:hypothetical protein
MTPDELRRKLDSISHPQGTQLFELAYGKPLEVDSKLADPPVQNSHTTLQDSPPKLRDVRASSPKSREYSIVGVGGSTQRFQLNATADQTNDREASLTVDGISTWIGPDSYDSGTPVVIEAVAFVSYHFTEWTGDVAAGHTTDNPLTLTMDSDKTIVAWFEAD